MPENNGNSKTITPDIPPFEVKGPQRERRGAGFPWFPNFAALQGKGVAVHVMALMASKFGLIAALGSIALGSAAVGVMTRNDDLSRRGANAKALTGQMRQDAAQSAQNEGLNGASQQGSMDGMAYIKNGAGGGDGAAGGDGANGSGSAAAGDGAAGADGAKAGDGAASADAAKAGAGAPGADALAAAAAAAAAKGAAPGAGSASPKLAKLPGFASMNSGGGGGGGGMGAGQGAGHGNLNAMKGGSDAGTRSAIMGKGQSARIMQGGRRTSGLANSDSLKRLSGMAGNMAANKAGNETSAAAQTKAWEAAAPSGQVVTGPGALAPSPQSGGSQSPGVAAGEGGPTISGGGGGSGAGTNVPEVPAYEDVTPYGWAVKLAKMLTLVIGILCIIMAILRKMMAAGPVAPAIATAYGILLKAIIAMGAVLALLGAYMLAMGQYWQGFIYTAIGGIAAITALAAPDTFDKVAAGRTALAGVGVMSGFFGADVAHKWDNGDYDKEHKDAYKKKYGVDPDNGKVVNKEKWDARYGKGQADQYNKTHGDLI